MFTSLINVLAQPYKVGKYYNHLRNISSITSLYDYRASFRIGWIKCSAQCMIKKGLNPKMPLFYYYNKGYDPNKVLYILPPR